MHERLIAFQWPDAPGHWGIQVGDRVIANVSHDTPAENERRARLFANAPRLLAALEGYDAADCDCTHCTRARKAITAAYGGAS